MAQWKTGALSQSIINEEKHLSMAFVNEYIPKEDIKKFGIEEIDKRYRKAHYKPYWTIDRAKNTYLRHMSSF